MKLDMTEVRIQPFIREGSLQGLYEVQVTVNVYPGQVISYIQTIEKNSFKSEFEQYMERITNIIKEKIDGREKTSNQRL